MARLKQNYEQSKHDVAEFIRRHGPSSSRDIRDGTELSEGQARYCAEKMYAEGLLCKRRQPAKTGQDTIIYYLG